MSDVPNFNDLKGFTEWWKTNAGRMATEQQAYYKRKYIDPLGSLLGWNESSGQWDTSKWPVTQWGTSTDPTSYAGKYSGYQTGMDALLARIGAGPQTSDISEANAAAGQMYGYTPEAWTAVQEGLPGRLNASNVMTSAANIASGLEGTPLAQQQKQAMDVAMRQAEAGVGKQLEAIFGARGGLAGFQAAYDMTSQLQDTYLQQQSQYNMQILDRALTAVNAENQYYQDLVNRGAIQAQDYVKFRWDALQTGYQDYSVAMNQTLSNFTQLTTQQSKLFSDQINAITSAMAQEMGLNDWSLQNIQGWYDFWSQIMQDYDAAGGGTSSGTSGGSIPGQGGQQPGTLSGGEPRDRETGGVGSNYGDLRGGGGAL